MTSVLIVGRECVTAEWARALRRAGYLVEKCRDTLTFQERFSGDPADVMVVDVVNADSGEAMLMAQARSVWPDCRVIAVSPDRSYQSSAIFGMGLWTPDLLLLLPVAGAQLLDGVRQVRSQAAADERLGAGYSSCAEPPDLPDAVILRCSAPVQARWLVKPA